MRSKWIPMCLIAAGIVSTANAQEPSAPRAQAPLTPAEVQLVNKLHAANLEEITAGQYATSHARNEAVKNYARALQKQHTEADRALQALVSQAGAKLREPQPGAAGTPKSINPATFDRPFLIRMASTNDAVLKQLDAAQTTAVNPQLRKMLTDLTPVLKEQRDQAVLLTENTL